jgi:hypothetical protein
MFFRRHKHTAPTAASREAALRAAGFEVSGAQVTRRGCTATLDAAGELASAGLLLNGQTAWLTDVGFQKMFITAEGRKYPATSTQLEALHAFTEDVRDVLDGGSFYNQGLGTTFERHAYDRLRGRA